MRQIARTSLNKSYEAPGYRAAQVRVRRQLQITKRLILCPFCLFPTPINQEARLATKLWRGRWVETHHLFAGQHWSCVGACSKCHQYQGKGLNGDRRRSYLHHPSRWQQYADRSHNHNVWWFISIVLIQYLIGMGLAWLIRLVLRTKH